MAHDYQLEFVEYVKDNNEDFFSNKRVLEVGSLNINGTVRDLFNDCNYIGIDVGEGNGVDVVCSGHEYDTSDDFDVTLSTECFEHNPYWAETFANMVRLTKSGGLVFFTCATTGRPEHGTTRTTPQDSPLTIKNMKWDYYLNLEEKDFRDVFEESFDEVFETHEFHSTVEDDKTPFIKNLIDKYKEQNFINGYPYKFAADLYFWGIMK
tara:strand:- start:101 stop:724 length:624 start_codon:yes stop_codon:yes gene_type:complete